MGERDPSVSPISQKHLLRKSANVLYQEQAPYFSGRNPTTSLFIFGAGKDCMLNFFLLVVSYS